MCNIITTDNSVFLSTFDSVYWVYEKFFPGLKYKDRDVRLITLNVEACYLDFIFELSWTSVVVSCRVEFRVRITVLRHVEFHV